MGKKFKVPSKMSIEEYEAFWKEALGKTRIGYSRVQVLKRPICAFKKVYVGGLKEVIANLIIPEGARVAICRPEYSWTAYKCRADQAFVHSLHYMASRRHVPPTVKAATYWDLKFVYTVGETVRPTLPFSSRGWDKHNSTCGSGIHFFVNLSEALDW